MPELSVLDYIKTVLAGKRVPAVPALPKGKAIRIRSARPRAVKTASLLRSLQLANFPWRSPLAFFLFIAAQSAWAGPQGAFLPGAALALLAVGATIWALRQGEWRLPSVGEAKPERGLLTFRRAPLLLCLFFFGLTFLFSGGNRFNFLNVTLWFLSIAFALASFWQTRQNPRSILKQFRSELQQKDWNLKISRWTILLVAAFALIAFFRFSQLDALPPEMTSDHAEKLLDVYDIQQGQFSIFFSRNAGRELLQFYLTLLTAKLFGTGISFLSLKLGTTILAFISLIYMYLLGKELGGRWVGFFALVLTGLSFWANIIARIGLRFSLFPTFAAPTLYYLLRGLRRGSLNDFLLSGLFLGIGLYGYTPFRVMPFVVGAALIVFLIHRATPEQRRRALIGFAVLALVSLIVFTPLLRYLVDNFAQFGERMLTRVSETERPYPGPVFLIFLQNVVRALGMFNVSGGKIWTVGLVGRPAFDFVTAALFLLGVCLLMMRYARSRNWQDLFLLVAVPLMMLPSTLSLAFPEENPAMNRASGAWIPAFLICALGLDAFLHGLRDRLPSNLGLRAAQAMGVLLLLAVAALNYDLFFHDYINDFDAYSLNTSEMGIVIADYANTFGTLDSAWVVPYPYWVDTRLVAMNAGYVQHDYAIAPDQLSNTLGVPAPKLFLLKPEDSTSLQNLQRLYPNGTVKLFQSRVPTHEFLVFFVPEPGGE